MVEVLVIFGLVGWLILTLLEGLSRLPFFPAIVMAGVLCPILSRWDYSNLSQLWKLRGVCSPREPIPPERFYWTASKPQLRRVIRFCAILSTLAWCNALLLPASFEFGFASIMGWLNAFVGVATMSRAISAGLLFFKASQWFDAMSPSFVGFLRHAMYKLSDNYEYLGSKKPDPEKEKVY
jgi:hypothetical protein